MLPRGEDAGLAARQQHAAGGNDASAVRLADDDLELRRGRVDQQAAAHRVGGHGRRANDSPVEPAPGNHRSQTWSTVRRG